MRMDHFHVKSEIEYWKMIYAIIPIKTLGYVFNSIWSVICQTFKLQRVIKKKQDR